MNINSTIIKRAIIVKNFHLANFISMDISNIIFSVNNIKNKIGLVNSKINEYIKKLIMKSKINNNTFFQFIFFFLFFIVLF